MKRNFILGLLFISIAANYVVGQDTYPRKKHELKVGYGPGTSHLFFNKLNKMQITDATRDLTEASKNYMGAFYGNYKYAITEKFNLGLVGAYEWGDASASANTFLDAVKTGTLKNNYYTLGVELDYIIKQLNGFTFYSTAGVAATKYDQVYTDINGVKDEASLVHYNFQINPVGIKYGETLGFFIEFGFGYRGLFTWGISLSL